MVCTSQQAGQGYLFSIPSHALLLARVTGSKSTDQDFCLHFCGILFHTPSMGQPTNCMKLRQSLSEMNGMRAAQPLAYVICLGDFVHSICHTMCE